MARALAWIGDGAPRMEVAHVERHVSTVTAVGTQLGAVYELRYRLTPDVLSLELVGERRLEVELGDADYFDLAWSPLFNSLPVVGDELLGLSLPREYTMRWVDVPSLEVRLSRQRYQPLGNRRVRFSAEGFTADIQFDQDGFVVRYPGIATVVAESPAS